MKLLNGIVCASITPMTAAGEIDQDSAARLYRHLGENGVHGIYPNGTNGESLSLLEAERQTLAEIAVREAKGPAVYIQSGSLRLEETVSHLRHAQAIGADGAGIVTPVYFKCDQEALFAYYSRALSAVPGLPVYIYNIPSCTGNDILPETLHRLIERFPQVRGIKYSAPDPDRIRAYRKWTEQALIGCDSMILACLIAGGTGTVSGPCAIFAKRFTRLYRQYQENDLIGAAETQAAICQTCEDMAGIPEIPAIKTVLHWLGIIDTDVCRAPFRRLTKEESVRLERVYDRYVKDEAL